jgi:hypothetical protein
MTHCTLPHAGSLEERVEIALSTAQILPGHLGDQMADVRAFLADFDAVPLPRAALKALEGARRHLELAQAEVHALSTAYLRR